MTRIIENSTLWFSTKMILNRLSYCNIAATGKSMNSNLENGAFIQIA